jgi:hypothetical protein
VGSINRRIVVQAVSDKSQDPTSKITKEKKVGGVAQAIEPLLSKCKPLNSNPSTANKGRQG